MPPGLLPGIIALFLEGMRWRIAILLGILSSVGLIVAGLYLDSFLRGGTIGNAANYVVHRAFILTAEMPYRVTERQLAGEKFDYVPTLFSVATNAVILEYIEPNEIYRYNLARSVSAYLYPDLIDEVNAGRWNHTPIVFSEGVLALGVNFYWFFAVLAATLTWSMDRTIRRKVNLLPQYYWVISSSLYWRGLIAEGWPHWFTLSYFCLTDAHGCCLR